MGWQTGRLCEGDLVYIFHYLGKYCWWFSWKNASFVQKLSDIQKSDNTTAPSQLSWKFIIRSNALFKSFDYKFDSRNGNFLFICFMLFPLYKLHCIFEDYLFDTNSFHISGLQKWDQPKTHWWLRGAGCQLAGQEELL